MIDVNNIYNFGESAFQLFFGELLTLHEWKGGDMKAPFWRCYCPLEKGGYIYHGGKEIPLLPSKGYIIPTLTDYECNLKNSFTKIYTHFSYEILGFNFLPGIYEFTLPKDDYKKIEEMRECTRSVKTGQSGSN